MMNPIEIKLKEELTEAKRIKANLVVSIDNLKVRKDAVVEDIDAIRALIIALKVYDDTVTADPE